MDVISLIVYTRAFMLAFFSYEEDRDGNVISMNIPLRAKPLSSSEIGGFIFVTVVVLLLFTSQNGMQDLTKRIWAVHPDTETSTMALICIGGNSISESGIKGRSTCINTLLPRLVSAVGWSIISIHVMINTKLLRSVACTSLSYQVCYITIALSKWARAKLASAELALLCSIGKMLCIFEILAEAVITPGEWINRVARERIDTNGTVVQIRKLHDFTKDEGLTSVPLSKDNIYGPTTITIYHGAGIKVCMEGTEESRILLVDALKECRFCRFENVRRHTLKQAVTAALLIDLGLIPIFDSDQLILPGFNVNYPSNFGTTYAGSSDLGNIVAVSSLIIAAISYWAAQIEVVRLETGFTGVGETNKTLGRAKLDNNPVTIKTDCNGLLIIEPSSDEQGPAEERDEDFTASNVAQAGSSCPQDSRELPQSRTSLTISSASERPHTSYGTISL